MHYRDMLVCCTAQVYARIKDAMEITEQAKLERDSALAQQASLQQQIETLQGRLAEAAKQLAGGNEGDIEGVVGGSAAALRRQVLSLQAALQSREAELTGVEQQVRTLWPTLWCFW